MGYAAELQRHVVTTLKKVVSKVAQTNETKPICIFVHMVSKLYVNLVICVDEISAGTGLVF